MKTNAVTAMLYDKTPMLLQTVIQAIHACSGMSKLVHLISDNGSTKVRLSRSAGNPERKEKENFYG